MAIFSRIPRDQEIVTQIVSVGMIGRKMILTNNGEENQKRKNLKSCVHIINLNHLIIHHHHHLLLYPSIKRNLNGLQKIAKPKSYPILSNPHHPYSLWQTQNARCQNETLVDIHKRVNHISLRTGHIESKMDSITSQMQQIYQNLSIRFRTKSHAKS